jgi:dTDP-4-amino-4,6-dideoxygalactose transaminase
MTELTAFAVEHGLQIVEDASHAHGATWRGVPCGRLGDVAVFSLQGDKLAPAGEGGVLLTDRSELWERAVTLGDITRILELDTPARRFAATSFGVKTRIAPMSAALGRAQLAKLPEHNTRRNLNHRRLSAVLEQLGFETFLGPAHVQRVYFEFLIRHRDPAFDTARVVAGLQADGCRVSAPRYPLVHQQPFFSEGHWQDVARCGRDLANPAPDACPRTAAENARLVRLPNFPGDDNGIIAQYAAAFERACEVVRA